MIFSQKDQERIYASMSNDEKSLVQSIQMATSLDEKSIVDGIIMDVQERRARFFDIIYVDLSIDRSNVPLQISGAGTGLIAFEATDNNASCEVSFELPESSANARITFKRGKGFYAPYSSFYVYHSAQSGKYMKILRVFATKSTIAGFQDDSGESANSDLVTALGNSTVIAVNQVSMSNVAAVIKAANTSRKRIIIKNPATNTQAVFIGPTNAVTAANGHCIDPGDAITLNCTGAIYGILAAGTLTVTYLEE